MLKRWRGFPLQLFAFIILTLSVLLIGIAFGSYALHQRGMRTLVGERDERATRAAASAITEQLNHRAAAIHSLALQVSLTGDPEHTLADATTFLPDFEGGLAIFTSDGALLSATNSEDAWNAREINRRWAEFNPDRDRLREVRFVPEIKENGSYEGIMFAAEKATDGSLVVGAFSPAKLAEQALSEIFSGSDQAVAYLVDARGELLYQHFGDPNPDNQEINLPGITEALRGESGTTYVSVAGDELVIAFSPVSPTNWALVLEEPWRAVADPLLRTTEIVPLILVPVLLAALVGLIFGVRQIVQPLQELEQKATRLTWGEYEAIEEPVGGINEIRHLQAELIHMARKAKAAQQNLRGYLGAVTAGQEEERRRLARELHDDTIQSLIALNQQCQMAQMALDDHPALNQLAEMQAMTTQTIDDLRRLTRDLRPIYLEDLGLVPALDMLARETSITLNIPVTFESTGVDRRLLPEVELALYRITQEALNNVSHHAQASQAALTLDFTPKRVSLKVVDDGCGFEVPVSPADMAPTGHFGLLGMQERAELVSARIKIRSTPGHGTNVEVILPA